MIFHFRQSEEREGPANARPDGRGRGRRYGADGRDAGPNQCSTEYGHEWGRDATRATTR